MGIRVCVDEAAIWHDTMLEEKGEPERWRWGGGGVHVSISGCDFAEKWGPSVENCWSLADITKQFDHASGSKATLCSCNARSLGLTPDRSPAHCLLNAICKTSLLTLQPACKEGGLPNLKPKFCTRKTDGHASDMTIPHCPLLLLP